MENRLNEEGFIMQYLKINFVMKNTFDRFLPDLRQRSRRIGLN